MNLTMLISVILFELCIYLVFSFVCVSHYQVVHGLWRCEILIRGVERGGGAGEGGGRGRGKHRVTGGHGAVAPVILHEVVQVGAGAGQVAAAYFLLLLKELRYLCVFKHLCKVPHIQYALHFQTPDIFCTIRNQYSFKFDYS